MRDPNHAELARVQAERDRLQHKQNELEDEIKVAVDAFNDRVCKLVGKIQSDLNRELVAEIVRLRMALEKAV